MVKVVGDTCPLYPDNIDWEKGGGVTHLGYAESGIRCIFLGSETVNVPSHLRFFRILIPSHGPVWIRSVWIRSIDDEIR